MNLDLKNGGSPYDTLILLPAGTAANPSVQVGGPGAGLYSPGTNQLSVTLGGTDVFQFGAAGVTVPNITANDITGGDSSLLIQGQAAAQGGSVLVTGGTSSTAGNAGGAVIVSGGINTNGPGGTASLAGGIGLQARAGGAVSVVGGDSGSGATGAGGAAAITGGAALSTNGAGGAITVTSGAGAGTGNGGAISVTTGAAGATGVAGVLALAVGAATAGNGSALTLAAGAGAGSTASGGNLTLAGGAAVSTGVPGEVQIAGDGALSFATYYFTGTPAATTQAFFVAPRAMRVKSIACVFSTAAGGTSTLDVTKDTTTAAPGAGTSLFQSGSFNLASTANTVQNATVSTTVATVNMAAGDRLSVKFANAIQATAGLVVTVGMQPA